MSLNVLNYDSWLTFVQSCKDREVFSAVYFQGAVINQKVVPSPGVQTYIVGQG